MIYNSDGTIRVYGHQSIVSSILQLSARSILIYGPHSVGKKTILEKYIQKNNFTDVLRFDSITKDNIDEIRKESVRALSGVRVIKASLTTMTKATTEKLLKVVEDAPDGVIFLISSGYRPNMALSSRFSEFKLGYLSNADVSLVLIGSGYSPERAAELAALSLGTIKETMHYGKYSENLAKVLEALHYVESGDMISLDSMYSTWDDKHTSLLRDVATEKLTGRYRLVTEEEVLNLSKRTAMRILTKVDPYDRARYVPRAKLASIARENMN